MKYFRGSAGCILCNNGDTGGKLGRCVHRDCDEEQSVYGGHQEIGDRDFYAMFGRGAAGGPEHHLHGKRKKEGGDYEGFESRNMTLAMRPFKIS